MIDVILLGEVFWVWVWVRARTAERALLYVAAMLTSLFVATHISPWFARRFMESGSTFEWLTDRIQAATHPVGMTGLVMPPVPAFIGLSGEPKWIALHILQGMLTVLMTWAIFMLFMVIEYLMQVFWDDEGVVSGRGDRVLANLAGLACGVAVAWSTIWFLANLSWVSLAHNMAYVVNESIIFAVLEHIVQFLSPLWTMLSWS
ncbi:hypothetical protein [Alicyclobacillus dauci]|uniref:Colicin V production protein n=1 Tax=Alicyclobacillus dauci TaxID=1475485 RepID=A0ABY6Z4Q2_9BACL|nr:hypothetical protein [Alicyclobacillus dauci]WAH36995.1 hypothetical protein NZD86_23035 [Alicyclobacillus dauci]